MNTMGWQEIIGEDDIRAVLGIQCDLEEIRKRAAVAVGAARAVGANRSRVNNVIAGCVLRENGNGGVAIDALGRIDVPLRPAIGGSVGTGWLHRGRVVGVARKTRAEPCHYDVAIGICGHPRKHIRFAYRSIAVHAHRSGPGIAQIGGRGKEHILIVGPDGVDVAETV